MFSSTFPTFFSLTRSLLPFNIYFLHFFTLVYSLCIGLLQILSTLLRVQVLVVVSGTSPHVPHNHSGNNDIKCLIFSSSEGVENSIISSSFHRSGGKWRDGVLRDILLLGSTHGSPPSHVRFWSRSSSHDDMCWWWKKWSAIIGGGMACVQEQKVSENENEVKSEKMRDENEKW